MLTPMDDYPLHQTPYPIAHPETSNPNQYDRYFFNGYREDLYFSVAMGRYPIRRVGDAAFALVWKGKQYSLFATGRAPLDPMDTTCGPIAIDVVEPLRTLRVTAESDEHDVHVDITFEARTAVMEEPPQRIVDGIDTRMDGTRLTQFGTWTGTITVAGETVDLNAAPANGTRDRSWGIRPIGDQVNAAPSDRERQILFTWAPLQFKDRCVHFLAFEKQTGERWSRAAAQLDVITADDPVWGPGTEQTHVRDGDFHIDWKPGLRRSQGAWVEIQPYGGEIERFTLEPLVTFRMRGMGYLHPKYAHGNYLGESVVDFEVFDCEELDSLDYTCIHVQQVMRATAPNGEVGLGIMEQLAFGPHDPTGLTGMLDGFQPT